MTRNDPIETDGGGDTAPSDVHHVYGAIVYETPERYHAAFIATAALAIVLGAQALSRKNPTSFIGRAGWWIAWSVNAVVLAGKGRSVALIDRDPLIAATVI